MHDRFIADTPKSYKTYDIFDFEEKIIPTSAAGIYYKDILLPKYV